MTDSRRAPSGAEAISHQPWARFDDLRNGVAWRFQASSGDILATARPAEVASILAAVEDATTNGQFAFGFLAYEAACGLDDALFTHPRTADGPPLAWFALADRPTRVPVVCPVSLGDAVPPASPPYAARWHRRWTEAEHHRDVEAVRARIAAGDTYQCNLTVRMDGRFRGDPRALYTDLVVGQGAEHNAYLDLGRFVIASASPELFFRRVGNRLLVRPMKGTAARGADAAADRRAVEDLRASPKERAENVIIVDLMRNDLGRIARAGTVSVTRLCQVEHYPTVLQMTSDIEARLRPDTGLLEIFRAIFPCGSVTGAPKPSTMRIITEVEDSPRGVYCGAIGWVAPPTAAVRARFSVAIRTAVIDRMNGTAEYGTGGGVTWSSSAAAEHAELLVKTRILEGPWP